MAIVCASRDSNTSSRLLLLGEINRIHRELLRDCFSEYNTSRVVDGIETGRNSFVIGVAVIIKWDKRAGFLFTTSFLESINYHLILEKL